MENSLIDSNLTACATQNKLKEKYVIVGGTAVALYGYYRPSMTATGELGVKPDLDIWYNTTYIRIKRS